MKILKILGIIVLVLVVLFLGLILLGPSTGHLERQVTINAPADVVYQEVSNLKAFNKWSPWFKVDPDMEQVYEGPLAGEGAKVTWYSEDQNVGNGFMVIAETVPNELVKMDMGFDQNMNRDFTDEGEEKPESSFVLSQDGDNTTVTWTFDISGVSGTGKMMVVLLDMFLGPMYEQGLADLKERVENRPEFKVTISLEDMDPISFIGHEVTTGNSGEEIAAAMTDSYGLISEVMVKNSLQSQGYPLSVINNYDETSITMICGIPVPEGTSIDNPELDVLQSHDGMALRGIHYGDYSLSESTHAEIGNFAEYYGYELGNPWEVYVTDPMVETDTSKWITEIYYPIQ